MKKRGVISIFGRYLFMEALNPLIFALLGLTIFFTSSQLYELTDMLMSKRTPVTVILQFLMYRLPVVFVLAFPISALFATVFALGRLMKDNEMIPVRVSGYGMLRIFIPFIILGLLVSFSTYWMNEQVVPWANHRAMNLLRMVMLKDVAPTIKENVFFLGPEDRYFYVRDYDRVDQILSGVMIYETRFSGLSSSFPRVILAERGVFHERVWELEDGVIHEFDQDGRIQSETKFASISVPIGDGLESFLGSQRTASEMSRDELMKEIQMFLKSGIRVNSWEVEYHLKLATPLASLIFVLVGVPLSMHQRKGWVTGVIMTIILAFAYYVAQSLGRSFGMNGILPPAWAAWLPNIIFAAFGLLLMIREEFFIPR